MLPILFYMIPIVLKRELFKFVAFCQI